MKFKSFIILLCLIPGLSNATDFYWVGGSGDWSDISHWATTSGGSVGHSQAPTPEDDVYFDANSFSGSGQVVTLNNSINFCRSMSWTGATGNPVLRAPEYVSLGIYGSFELIPAMTFDFVGRIIFSGEGTNKSINFANKSAGPDMQFSGSGSWVLDGAVNVDSMLHIFEGNIDFNDMPLTTDHFYITGSSQKSLDFRNSVITIKGAFLDDEFENDRVDIKSAVVNVSNLTVNKGGSQIIFEAENPAIWFTGDGQIALNEMAFTSLTGNAIILNYDGDPDISLDILNLSSSARISGDVDIGFLAMNGGKVYEFESGRIFDIGSISVNSNCAEGVVINAIDNGVQATFNVNSGSVALSFTSLRDIIGTGGASFSVDNGVDLGGNGGWTFTNSDPEEFYWIGGTGSWTDPSHWSFVSGGTSSGCVPTGKDNVFFDVNSFSATGQVVTVDIENIYVRNMLWNGALFEPEFAGDLDFRVRITGSLELQSNMKHTFAGFYHFESNVAGNEITMNGNVFNRDIIFNGISGEWTFKDSIEINRALKHFSGKIITDGNDLTMVQYLAESMRYKFLDIRGSNVLLRQTDDDRPYWTVWLDNYNTSTKSSVIEITGGHYSNFSHFVYNSDGGLPEYNKVIFSNYTGEVYSYNYELMPGEAAVIIDSLIYNTRGYIGGNNRFNYLQLQAGADYGMESYDNSAIQQIGELVMSGTCDEGLTRIYGNEPRSAANLQIDQDYTFDRLDITDINVQGGSITANNSVDGGGNTNITFSELVARTLYWVGDGGDWEDPSHWSLTSGGVGGECIPTIIDDVFFDENSFTQDFQSVESSTGFHRTCHDITWSNVSNMPNFFGNYLIVDGSLDYDQSFNNYLWRTIFTSNDEENLVSGGQSFQVIEVRNSANLTITEDVRALELSFNAGVFSLDNIKMSIDWFYLFSNAAKTANFNASEMEINGVSGDPNYPPFRDFTNNIDINFNPGTSTVSFTGVETGIYTENNLNFHNIVFTDPAGQGFISTKWNGNEEVTTSTLFASAITFSGNGQIGGRIETDTLIGSPGKSYVLEKGHTNDVFRFLRMIGNNCAPIELRSNSSGEKATIRMPESGRVLANFLQLQDNIGTGGANFNAGSRSTDIDNSNIGWIFEDAPEIQESGFLGPDRALCMGEDALLNAYSFSPEESYIWSDGSMDSVLSVSAPGTYFVQVEFQSSCILRDTVEILDQVDIMPDLAPTFTGCDGDLILLDPNIPVSTAIYSWSTGSDEAQIEVSEGGNYSVQVDVDGCITTASTVVTIITNPGLELGDDRSVCEGEPFTISSNITLNNYLWQDGTTSETISSSQSGLFWLETAVESCTFRDSVLITSVDRPEVELGDDRAVCDNEEAFITYENTENFDVLWQDGSTNNSIEITSEGKYKIIVDDDGCTSFDSIMVSILAAPVFDLGDDQEACAGEEIELNAPSIANFEWEDGSSEEIRTVTASGVYFLIAEENGCFSKDSVSVDFKPNPRINLGRDTTVCDDVPFVISAVSDRGEIVWGDGSMGNTLSIDRPGEYFVTVIEEGCSSSDSIMIGFKECISFKAYIPNAISPNEDGVNDLFEVYFSDGLIIESFAMKVFDRWGNRVFETTEYGDFWNGKVANNDLRGGTYIYFIDISYVDDFGSAKTQLTGDVSIID